MSSKENMLIYVDLDQTICCTPQVGDMEWDFSKSKPIWSRIEDINALYDLGHTIIYWTARKATTDIEDIEEITLSQLEKWGCKYHKLDMSKPYFDILIDDHARESVAFFNDHKDYSDLINNVYKL